MIDKKIFIATGGTGGHIFPAYSLAKYLARNNFTVKLTTDSRGLNYLKNYKNIDFIKIPSSPLVNKNFFTLIISVFLILYSIVRSIFFLLLNRPALVIGMGGYSSFSLCIAAKILMIKFIIYENNLILGKSNKYLLPFANKLFVSYEELEGIAQKYKDKIIVVGNIIREEIIDSEIVKEKKKKVEVFDCLNILILGGSQAAEVFGNILPEIFKKFKSSGASIKIYQQCQKKQSDKLVQFYKRAKIDSEIFNFTDKIINYYTKANLVITRSGASVLGELINLKTPFITIPFPFSADNHQLKNAQFYEKKGYGLLLEEKDIKDKLYELINKIFKDRSITKEILLNQRKYSDKDIFRNLEIHIKKILNEKN